MAKKFREVRKALLDAGWIQIRQAGSHETWRSADGERMVAVAGKDSEYLSCRNLVDDPTRDRDRVPSVKSSLVISEQAEDGGWGAHSPDVDGVFDRGCPAHLSYRTDAVHVAA